jgi:hypothetical protein
MENSLFYMDLGHTDRGSSQYNRCISLMFGAVDLLTVVLNQLTLIIENKQLD